MVVVVVVVVVAVVVKIGFSLKRFRHASCAEAFLFFLRELWISRRGRIFN